MTFNTLPPPIWLDNQDDLVNLVNRLSAEPRFAVDTESNSLFAYQEQVCLIQISIPGVDYLLDSMAVFELDSLGVLMNNPKIEKVFHGAEYDFICLKRDFGFSFSNIFDTRVALRTLGYEQTGLGNVLAAQFDVTVNKRYQRADWGKRPLPQEQLNYARLDTHYLLQLRDQLARELQSAGRWDEATEDCERIAQIEIPNNGVDPNRFWKITNARKLKPQDAAILRELYSLREEHARRLDRPPFKVFSDRTMMTIAQEQPKNIKSLKTVPGMSDGQIRRYGRDLLSAVSAGKKAKPARPPKNETSPEDVISRYKRIHEWRKLTARKRKVESDVVLPRDMIWEIARHAPTRLKELKKLMQPLNWRFKTYGEEILKLVYPEKAQS
jgi:ribonuclease D